MPFFVFGFSNCSNFNECASLNHIEKMNPSSIFLNFGFFVMFFITNVFHNVKIIYASLKFQIIKNTMCFFHYWPAQHTTIKYKTLFIF